MAIYYIDPSGSAGTGDGTSFANRCQHATQLDAGTEYNSSNNIHYYTPVGEHEIRYIKNPDEYTIDNVSTKRTGSIWRQGYGMPSVSSQYNYITLSTTKGASQFYSSNHGLRTGDWIEWHQAQWYFNDANYGDPNATNNQPGNRMGLNGIWKVTVTDKDYFKLDGFTGPFNKSTSDQFTSGGSFPISIQYSGNWRNITSEVLEFSSALPIQHILPGRDECKYWTTQSNTTIYDNVDSYNSWGNSYQMKPGDYWRFNISSSASVGKCAHYELPATLDLSAFQGVSYEMAWISGSRKTRTDNENDDGLHNGQTDTGAGRYSLRLCTDTAGETSAHTIPLSSKYVPGTTNRRGCNQFNTDGNMNAAIKSVAIYKDDNTVNNDTCEFQISDLIAYKTSGQIMTHRSHFGWATADDPHYFFPQQFYNDATEGIYAIKLGVSYKYYLNRYSEWGYYGSSGCWWSEDKTNQTITVQQPFTFGRNNSTLEDSREYNYNFKDSSNRSDDYYTFACPTNMFAGGPSPSNNSPTAWKKISGGWNRTDMSTRTNDTDTTFFDQGWCGSYGGFRQSWGATAQEWSHFHISRSAGIGWEGSWTITRKLYCNLCSVYDSSNNTTHMEWFTTNCYGTQIKANNTQDYQGVNDPYASDKWKLHWHGGIGQEGYYVNGIKSDFSVFNTEMTYSFSVNRDASHSSGDVNLGDVYFGWHGRDTNGGKFHIGGNDTTGGTVTINNAYGVRAQFSIGSSTRVTLGNYVHKKLPDYASNLGYTTDYDYYVLGNNENTYSIYNNSQFFNWNGGSIQKKIYTDSPMKINNISNTDPTAHQISGSTAYIQSANDGGVSGAGKYYGYYWTMEPETTIVKTAGGKSWKITKTSTNGVAKHSIGKIAVAGSGTVTVKIWMYRTNTGTTSYGKLIIPADSTLGISSDQVANNTAGAANTWEEITVTASPTSAGIMEVQIETATDSSTSSGSVYFDDMTVEQS